MVEKWGIICRKAEREKKRETKKICSRENKSKAWNWKADMFYEGYLHVWTLLWGWYWFNARPADTKTLKKPSGKKVRERILPGDCRLTTPEIGQSSTRGKHAINNYICKTKFQWCVLKPNKWALCKMEETVKLTRWVRHPECWSPEEWLVLQMRDIDIKRTHVKHWCYFRLT